MKIAIAILALLLPCVAAAEVIFHDDFESASLNSVSQTAPDNYKIITRQDPVNPLDSTAHRSSRWFYFMISGVKNKTLTLDIPYSDMQRAVYSYDNISFERFNSEEMPILNGEITKKFLHDSVYIAYSTPYTSLRAQQQIAKWSKDRNVQQFTLTKTSLGTAIDGVVISENLHPGLVPNETNEINPTATDRAKKVVYIHGRIHPSESPASWNLEALIDKIIEDRDGILHNTIFYIIPFTNPDGVSHGYSRTNPTGVNLEVNYNHPKGETEPEVAGVKQLLKTLQNSGLEPSIALNMHSQSTPKLTYWIHTAESTSKRHMQRSLLFAALTTAPDPLFRWQNLSYSTLKDHFLEGWIYREFGGRAIALTFETPYSFYDGRSSGEWVTAENLQRQAQYTLNAITDILGVGSRSRIAVDEPRRAHGFKSIRGDGYLHHGKSHLIARGGGFKLRYTTDELAEGDYNIYRWVTPRAARHQSYETGRWEFVREHIQTVRGRAECIIESAYRGERHDRIIYVLKSSY